MRDLVDSDKFDTTFVYFVDPDSFVPVSGHLTIKRKGGRTTRGPEFRVTSYERLPLDGQTAELLKLQTTPKTKYVWR